MSEDRYLQFNRCVVDTKNGDHATFPGTLGDAYARALAKRACRRLNYGLDHRKVYGWTTNCKEDHTISLLH